MAAISPVTDLAPPLEDELDEPFGRVMVSYCLWSWSRVYRAPLEPYASPELLQLGRRSPASAWIRTGRGVRRAARRRSPRTSRPASIATSPPWNRLLDENRPGRAPAGAPLYVAQGLDDPIVRPSVTADFVAGLCRAGATVRYETFTGRRPPRIGRVSATSAIQWMQSRFEGVRRPTPARRSEEFREPNP